MELQAGYLAKCDKTHWTKKWCIFKQTSTKVHDHVEVTLASCEFKHFQKFVRLIIGIGYCVLESLNLHVSMAIPVEH